MPKREHPAATRRRAEEAQATDTELQRAVHAMRAGRIAPPTPDERPEQARQPRKPALPKA